MCAPVIATTLAIASAAANVYGQRQAAKAQLQAIAEQERVQAEEIARAAGVELTERARAARRERARARAAASEAGVNLNSGSFIAALQTSAMNQYNDMGLIVQNERAQQRARAANARSARASVRVPSALQSALTIASAGYGAYRDVKAAKDTAARKATG